MNRRAFLGTLLGAGAAVTAEAVAPSLVWPFRKYFLPSNWARWIGMDWGYNGCLQPGSVVETSGFVHLSNNGIYRIDEAAVEAIELEEFAKQIPDLIYSADPMWKLFKSREGSHRLVDVRASEVQATMEQFNKNLDAILAEPPMRIPFRDISPPKQIALLNRAGIFPDEQPKRGLLHKKATVENIVRFVDELQES